MKNKGVMISLAAIALIGMIITIGTHNFIEKNTISYTAPAQLAVQDMDAEAAEREDAGGEEKAAAEGGLLEDASEDKLKETDSGARRSADDQEKEDRKVSERPEPALVLEDAAADVISPLDPNRSSGEGEENQEENAEAEITLNEFQPYYLKRLQDLDSQIQKNRENQDSINTGNSAKSAASNELKLWDSELNAIYNVILDRLDQEESEELVRRERAWVKERDSLAMEAAKKSAGGSGESIEYTLSLMESTRKRAYELAEEYASVLEEQ